MKKIIISVLLMLPLSVFATTGGGLFVDELRYSPKENAIYYSVQNLGGRGGSDFLKLSLEDKSKDMVIAYDDFANDVQKGTTEAKDKKERILKELEPLKEVDLKKLGIDFKFEQGILENSNLAQTTSSDIFDWNSKVVAFEGHWPPKHKEERLQNFSAKWRVYPSINGKEKTPLIFPMCLDIKKYNVDIKGYAIPEVDKLILRISAPDYCYESMYTVQTIHFVEDIIVPEKYFIGDSISENEQYEQMNPPDVGVAKSRGGYYTQLEDPSRFLNEVGYQAYQEQKYQTAVYYFDFAYEKNDRDEPYYQALFNSAATRAKIDDEKGSLKKLKKLFSFEDKNVVNEYKNKVINDFDFGCNVGE